MRRNQRAVVAKGPYYRKGGIAKGPVITGSISDTDEPVYTGIKNQGLFIQYIQISGM
jgi:hypothetical protein